MDGHKDGRYRIEEKLIYNRIDRGNGKEKTGVIVEEERRAG